MDRNNIQIAARRVEFKKESNLDNNPVRMKIPFSVEQSQKLKLKFIPINGNIILNGLVINPVESFNN